MNLSSGNSKAPLELDSTELDSLSLDETELSIELSTLLSVELNSMELDSTELFSALSLDASELSIEESTTLSLDSSKLSCWLSLDSTEVSVLFSVELESMELDVTELSTALLSLEFSLLFSIELSVKEGLLLSSKEELLSIKDEPSVEERLLSVEERRELSWRMEEEPASLIEEEEEFASLAEEEEETFIPKPHAPIKAVLLRRRAKSPSFICFIVCLSIKHFGACAGGRGKAVFVAFVFITEETAGGNYVLCLQ